MIYKQKTTCKVTEEDWANWVEMVEFCLWFLEEYIAKNYNRLSLDMHSREKYYSSCVTMIFLFPSYKRETNKQNIQDLRTDSYHV